MVVCVCKGRASVSEGVPISIYIKILNVVGMTAYQTKLSFGLLGASLTI